MDKKYVTYELSLIQEVMHFLNEVNTDKSKRLLRKMICPNPRKEMSEEEIQIRCMTNQERLDSLRFISSKRLRCFKDFKNAM